MCINCSECQNKKQFVCTTCSPNVLSLSFSCIEVVNQYCGLVDVRINASDKNLPIYVYCNLPEVFGDISMLVDILLSFRKKRF